MITREKKDLIIKLHLQGMNQDDITHEAKASATTVVKVTKEFDDSNTKSEETLAFEKFDQGYVPVRAKIELDISAEKIARSYLAYKKLVALVDLVNIHKELGNSISEFVAFYKEAKENKITLGNMRYALNSAYNIQTLQQEILNASNRLQESNKAVDAAKGTLAEVQWQTTMTDRANFAKKHEGIRLQGEIERLNSILEKLKNLNEYQKFEQIISNTVNSITGEQYLTLELGLMAVLKKIQRDPSIIPLLFATSPDEKPGMVDPALRQSFLAGLCSQAMKIMPEVIDELMELTSRNALPNLMKFQNWLDEGAKPDTRDSTDVAEPSGSEKNIQENTEVTSQFQSGDDLNMRGNTDVTTHPGNDTNMPDPT